MSYFGVTFADLAGMDFELEREREEVIDDFGSGYKKVLAGTRVFIRSKGEQVGMFDIREQRQPLMTVGERQIIEALTSLAIERPDMQEIAKRTSTLQLLDGLGMKDGAAEIAKMLKVAWAFREELPTEVRVMLALKGLAAA